MARISKDEIYNFDLQPSLLDYLIGTDFDDYKKTKSYRISAILELLNSANGISNVQYYFSNGTNPELDLSTRGIFFADTNEVTDPTLITSLRFNKEMLSGTDISELFTVVGGIDNVVLTLRNPSNPNNFFNFSIISVIEAAEYFLFEVEVFNGFYCGELIDEMLYGVYFDVKAAGGGMVSYDRIVSMGNITIDGAEVTIPANAQWLISNNNYTNALAYVVEIDPEAEGFVRTDIIVATTMGFTVVDGTPTNEGTAVQPTVPDNAILVTVIQINGLFIGEPTQPEIVNVELRGQNLKLTIPLTDFGVATFAELTPEIFSAHIDTLDHNTIENYLIEVEGENTIVYNFDVTADWANANDPFVGNPLPVTNQASFEEYLGYSLGAVTITDFNLTAERLQCNIATEGVELNLKGSNPGVVHNIALPTVSTLLFNVHQLTSISGFETLLLTTLGLDFGTLTNTLGIENFPNLNTLYIGENQLSNIDELYSLYNLQNLIIPTNNLSSATIDAYLDFLISMTPSGCQYNFAGVGNGTADPTKALTLVSMGNTVTTN